MSEGDKAAVFVSGNHAPVLPVFAAAVTDADFVVTPPDGAAVVTDGKLSVRIAGTWETFTPSTLSTEAGLPLLTEAGLPLLTEAGQPLLMEV